MFFEFRSKNTKPKRAKSKGRAKYVLCATLFLYSCGRESCAPKRYKSTSGNPVTQFPLCGSPLPKKLFCCPT